MFLDVDFNTSLKLQGEILEVVEQSTYLGSCVSSDGSLSNEIDARILKARIAFANLRHLWRQIGISLSLKGCMYKTTVRAVLFYGSETASSCRGCDNRCLRSITRWLVSAYSQSGC